MGIAEPWVVVVQDREQARNPRTYFFGGTNTKEQAEEKARGKYSNDEGVAEAAQVIISCDHGESKYVGPV
jgi:hypothetical protein